MKAVRLHGPADLRVDEVPRPGRPGPGQVLLRVKAVGICGSDMHSYRDGRIGDVVFEKPLIVGHEFTGVVEAVGPDAADGEFRTLRPGTRVAVDPAQPCGRCSRCEQGDPNLCENLHFTGLYPDSGALCEFMLVPSRTCFPIPDTIDDATAVMLEPLAVALHTLDLAKVRVGKSVAVIGAGPIGLCILQLAKLSGANPVLVSERLPWRLDLAGRFGAIAINCTQADPVKAVLEATAGRGADVAIEAAWSDSSVQQAAEMLRLGGRLVVVGIPADDRLTLKHGTARRKGLTIMMVRRTKHCYPRAISLVERGVVELRSLVTHRFPLALAPEAFALNARYADGIVKAVITI